MNKSVKHSFSGMNQDLSKSISPNTLYYEGKNIRIITTNSQSTGAVTNEKGNSLIIDLPIPIINSQTNSITYIVNNVNKSLQYNINTLVQPRNEIEETYYISNNNYRTSGEQIIIGHGLIRNNIILFTTDNNGFDCIWKVDDKTYDLELLYLRNLEFNTTYPIQVINNYENENIDKVYWVDGRNQMRFVNIHHSIENQDLENLIDLSFNSIQMVGTFDLNQPEILGTIQGGIHTSGMIQYAYNLYRINGSQTKISPLTELIPLNKGENLGGGELNEIVGTIPIIKISDLDSEYSNIKLYAIKYTSYNQLPQISLILDRSILDSSEIIYYDDGNIIQNISNEEFLFIGSDIVIPKHINTKKNRMFLANYMEKNFDINTYSELNSIDLRAYSFAPNTTTTPIYNSLYETPLGDLDSLEPSIIVNNSIISTDTPKINYKFAAINKNYDLYNRQYNSNIVGGEGAYIKYKVNRNQIGVNNFTLEDSKKKFIKDNEVYRIAIQFYNKYGQNSLPKWVADFKNIIIGNQSNLNGYYSSLEITFKPLFYTWLNNNANFLDENGIYDETLKPVGYRLLRAERNLVDRTILCQGLLNGMLSQCNGDTSDNNEAISPAQKEVVNKGLKIPSMIRRFDEYLSPMWGNKTYRRLDRASRYDHPAYNGFNDFAGLEVFNSIASSGKYHGTYQFNQLMQMFSPEITFNILQNIGNTNLNIVGGIKNNSNQMWGQIRDDEGSKQTFYEIKTRNSISRHDIKSGGTDLEVIQGGNSGTDVTRFGMFAPGYDMQFLQTYRQYTGNFITANKVYDTYGVPVIVEKAQGRTIYNNNPDLIFNNTLEALFTDSGDGSGGIDDPDRALNGVNTWGARNITFALGKSETTPIESRLTLEALYQQSNINDTSVGLVGEFRIPNNLIYLGNIYGGSSYESKKRSNYIEVGSYNLISNNIYNCLHFGDTFIQDFKFTKFVKTDTEIYSASSEQLTEIVNFKCETTVDLSNRNDESIQEWDNKFQPKYEDYNKYNRVYSQDSNFIIRKDSDYKFKKVNSFDTNIISTKVKVPGEIIDSWTDLQPNEVLTLDGKYGPINSLHNFKDEIYSLQDSALAFISILPRVQTQGSDGIGVELGFGSVLQEYKYITTESGTKNKWSVVSSPSGFYYYDLLNKSINLFNGKLEGLVDSKGLHQYFINNVDDDLLIVNNPILKQGVNSGFDYINNDMFMTFHQGLKSFTLSFNENIQQFVSFYDYIPSMYISRGSNFITTHPDNNKLYKQYEGNYNEFYGVRFPSSIILLVNPEPDFDTILDNIMYKSEVYLNKIDQPSQTLTNVQVYNEYQDSNLIPLILGRDKNLRRKFRDWNAILPRNNNSRNRIRNPWNFLKLQFNNDNNYELILHNINVFYTVNN